MRSQTCVPKLENRFEARAAVRQTGRVLLHSPTSEEVHPLCFEVSRRVAVERLFDTSPGTEGPPSRAQPCSERDGCALENVSGFGSCVDRYVGFRREAPALFEPPFRPSPNCRHHKSLTLLWPWKRAGFWTRAAHSNIFVGTTERDRSSHSGTAPAMGSRHRRLRAPSGIRMRLCSVGGLE